MKIILTILFVFASGILFAQTSFLKDAVTKLDKALVTKDTVTLKQLLHKDLTYGHSNGWVETKNDVINDLVTGNLTYDKIESKDLKWTVSADFVSLRCTTDIAYGMDGKKGDLHLHVLQVWVKSGTRWQLIARQSTKL